MAAEMIITPLDPEAGSPREIDLVSGKSQRALDDPLATFPGFDLEGLGAA